MVPRSSRPRHRQIRGWPGEGSGLYPGPRAACDGQSRSARTAARSDKDRYWCGKPDIGAYSKRLRRELNITSEVSLTRHSRDQTGSSKYTTEAQRHRENREYRGGLLGGALSSLWFLGEDRTSVGKRKG